MDGQVGRDRRGTEEEEEVQRMVTKVGGGSRRGGFRQDASRME